MNEPLTREKLRQAAKRLLADAQAVHPQPQHIISPDQMVRLKKTLAKYPDKEYWQVFYGHCDEWWFNEC